MHSIPKTLRTIKQFVLVAGASCLPALSLAQSAEPRAAPAASSAERVFARVDGHPLYASTLHAAFNGLLRKKYYHGQVPQDEIAAVMKEAQDQVIDTYLLEKTLERMDIQPDQASVEAELAQYEARYRGSPQWAQNREEILPGLRAELEKRSKLAVLEKNVKAVQVEDAAVAAFYAAKPELFTEPEKIRLQSILLSVDPSSPAAARQSARDEAKRIVMRLREGADFAEAARLHSHDKTAEQDGDMGFLHRGMLPEELQGKLDQLKTGEISDPLDVLEGVAILRITDRLPAKLRSFSEVKDRARSLVERERQDAAWQAFLEKLRGSAKIEVLESGAQPR